MCSSSYSVASSQGARKAMTVEIVAGHQRSLHSDYFSWSRFAAMVFKEFIQMRRDRLTFAIMIGIPLIQLTLFGFAINSDPKHLPTALLAEEQNVFVRTLRATLQQTGYFDFVAAPTSSIEADRMLASGEVQFVVHVPAGFARRLIRGERPALLVEADATDPVASVNAMAALTQLAPTAFDHDLTGPLRALKAQATPFDLRIHRRYNPEAVAANNIVPGLMGVILTMTMVMMTGVAITREQERGTMENLLAMPVRPLEVMAGKIVPYVLVGYIQVGIILLAMRWVFQVPMQGNLFVLLGIVFLFIAANLMVGITFSTLARNQMQAMQMTFFFFLPSLLLSGFMFPFRGMPGWAQTIGEALPLTHFLRVVRGILLKGNGFALSLPEVWPIVAFFLAAMLIGLTRYRRTLD
jgi:ABC-2 type transport system permease protein